MVGYRYFANGRAQTWNDGSTYAGEGVTAHTRSYEWPHALSEIIGSLLAAGLVRERFDEGKTLPWRFSELTTPIDGSWEFGPEWRDRIPCTFTTAARKPRAGSPREGPPRRGEWGEQAARSDLSLVRGRRGGGRHVSDP
ncbi:hypothetical protein [Microbacterium sp. gxy059]|uniref:hypothetical protein n=1 Tax=Microbacterium sp. gxy059 TaxID=2957199 RepID=UPI003D97796A